MWEAYYVHNGKVTRGSAFGNLPDAARATLVGRAVHFTFNNGRLDGLLQADGMAIKGSWTAPGLPARPMTLIRHWQTPIAPLPYDSTEVTYPSGDGTIIAGTVTAPRSPGKKAAIVLIVGSLPADRDYVGLNESPAQKPFAVLADDLTRHGIVVLRYDERGVGRSGGDYIKASEAQLEQDISAGLALLAARSDVDPTRIGVIGHSEGGILAGRIAANDPRVAFAILLATPSLPGLSFATTQAARIARSRGLSPAEAANRAEITKRIDAAVLESRTQEEARSNIRKALQGLKQDGALIGPIAIENNANLASTDLYRFLLTDDPAVVLRTESKPILALMGGDDIFVDPALNLSPLKAALRNDAFATICLLPGISHRLRTGDFGGLGDGDDIVETIDPFVLGVLDAWLSDVANVSRK